MVQWQRGVLLNQNPLPDLSRWYFDTIHATCQVPTVIFPPAPRGVDLNYAGIVIAFGFTGRDGLAS